jgi:1-acyl-sn-glycerol-3-phosphate acyltransferase
MVLEATAGRPIIFLTAREVYESPSIKWLCKSGFYIPVNRGTHDVGAVRAMLRALRRGEVVALFPEGGIDEHREDDGHLGIGYLALKTGAPVVPASIAWDSPRPPTLGQSLVTPGKAIVRYGEPIVLPSGTPSDRNNISLVTDRIMRSIRELQNQASVLSR